MFSVRAVASAILLCVLPLGLRATIEVSLQMQTGNPSAALATQGNPSDPTNHDHYLMQRAQYALDFSDHLGDPNWVAWDLTSTDSGTVSRSNFLPDPDLPAGFYAVTTTDYNGVGTINFNRGHMCPSADRNASTTDNQFVFYMTNIVPQAADNNQGPWEVLETYSRSLAAAGNELLIMSGPSLFGSATINNVAAIPNYVWKIILVVPAGSGTALSRVDANTRVIAVKMPNVNGIRNNSWTDYIVSVSEIEADTGFRFFTSLPTAVADGLRAKVDSLGTSGAPLITSQPTSQTVLAGASVTFTVGASGSALVYQWYKDGDAISNATAPSYTLSNAQAGDAGNYYAIVTNGLGAVTSNAATLTISAPTAPTIATQPTSQTVSAGGTATFTVVATGLPAPTYQWTKVGGGPISGATSATLTLANVQSADNGTSYTVTVTNSAGSATSNAATLTVQSTPPSITAQPSSASVTIGGSTTFGVTATGTAPLTYQWRKNGTAITGATNPSLSLAGIQTSDGGSYDVVVSNAAGSSTSSLAVLSVSVGGTTTNSTQVLYAGGTYTQNFNGLPSTGTFNVSASGPNTPVYLNASPISATNLDGWTFAQTLASGGTTRFLVSDGSGGTFTGSVYSFGTTGSAERALGVCNSGSNRSVYGVTLFNNTGQTITSFTIGYTGEQWRWGGATGDKLSVEYQINGSNIVTGTFTAIPALDFTSPVQSGTVGAVDGNASANRRALSATVSSVSWPANQTLVIRWKQFRTATADGLSADDFSFSTSVGGAVPTVAVSSTSPAANAGNVSVGSSIGVTFNQPVTAAGNWFTITSATNGLVSASATGGPTTYTITPSASFAYSDTLGVTLNAAQISDQGTGTTHPTSNYTWSFTTAAPTAPAITTQPVSQAVVVGGSASFSVVATGTAPLSYQWKKGTSAIPGATNSTLTLSGVTLGDAGSYTVDVNNVTAITATSSPAVLTVSTTPIAPSIVSQPLSQTIALGGNATFSVTAGGTTPFTYQWRKNGVAISGATSSTLALSGVTYQSTASYDVVVSNGTTPDAISNPASLTVYNAAGLSVLYFAGAPYTQNFNTLPASGSFGFSGNGPFALDATVANGGVNAIGMTGWSFAKYAGTGGNAVFSVGTGSDTSGTAASYGSSSSSDRALGSLASGSVVSRFGIMIVNASNQTITQFTLGYAGEQWRKGGSNLANTLTFAYALGATDINTGTFTDVSALSFSSPIVTTTSGSLDGNAYANRTIVGGQVTGLNWLPGQVLVLRWSDANDNGSDDGLAIDDLTFTTAAAVAPAITAQPTAQTVFVGSNVTFTVAATGTPPPSYQWRKGGVPVAGATKTTLTLNNVTTASAGDYDCVVTNGIAPSVSSNVATLVVNKLPATVTLNTASLAATYDGSSHAATATTSPAGLAVTFAYDGNASAPTNAGSYVVVATINDATYTGSTTGTLVISPAASVIIWSAPGPIVYGTALSGTQLNATANTAGAFTYSPAAGAILNAGPNQPLAVAFTPSDTTNYTTAYATTAITVTPAPAVVTFSNTNQTYDGAPKPVPASISPAGVGFLVYYNGSATVPTNAGSYALTVVSTNPNYVASGSGTLTIAKAVATVTLSGLVQNYDGLPKSVTVTTDPINRHVDITYSGSPVPPIAPGSYAIVATVNEANYTGSATGTLTINVTALIRHAPTINGMVAGSVQVASGEAMTLDGNSAISGDLLVPGSPVVQVLGHATYGSTLEGSGEVAPDSYAVTLNGNAALRHVVRRTNALSLPLVALPPSGTQNVALNGNARSLALAAGNYGTITVNAGSTLVLGTAGSTTPALYNAQTLTLNGNATIQVVGPVLLTLANGATLSATAGTASHPEWLTLAVAAGGVTLNGGATLNGTVLAPNGTVTLNANSTLNGSVSSDRLTLGGNALLNSP